jgi:hypothetical protein
MSETQRGNCGQEPDGRTVMAYTVGYNAEEDYVWGRIDGVVDLDTAHRYAREIIKQLSAHNCLRFLNDMRQASVQLSTLDIYDLPAWIEEAVQEAGVSRACKRALVVASDFNEYKFFETVSRNHGHLVEVFTDSDTTGIFRNGAEACEWLGLKTNPLTEPGVGKGKS